GGGPGLEPRRDRGTGAHARDGPPSPDAGRAVLPHVRDTRRAGLVGVSHVPLSPTRRVGLLLALSGPDRAGAVLLPAVSRPARTASGTAARADGTGLRAGARLPTWLPRGRLRLRLQRLSRRSGDLRAAQDQV